MKLSTLSLLLLTSCLFLHSCLKKTPGEPPSSANMDPYLACNDSLGHLARLAQPLGTGKSRVIVGDTTVFGIVVGDDKSGNIYKKIIIEDTFGGGISVILDRTYLYADYPVGRKIYIKMKGLSLVNYKGTPEIVYSVNTDGTTNGIPSALISNYIVKASYPHTITPKLVTFIDLYSNSFKYCNTLIQMDHMQFDNSSAGTLYSDPNTSTNRTIQDCSKTASLTMYNSSYANFQPYTTPTGNGTIVGLVSVYISTPQFTLRDTTDIHFTDPRCP